jgi:hypothetical protein
MVHQRILKEDKETQYLWFTSSTSLDLMGNSTASYKGLYKCELDPGSGLCHSPELITDEWIHDGRLHRGIKLMNVQLHDAGNTIYARTFDAKRDSWEIIRAPIDSSITFEPYFRTQEKLEWNDCGFKCCEPTGYHYLMVKPKTFFLDDDDIYIAWDGFWKDCSDAFSRATPRWTIGVSRLKKDPECVLTGGDSEANFALCTEPVAIVYQNDVGRSRVLPYGGFQITKAPDGTRIYFLSVMHSAGIDEGKLTSEVWVAPEGIQHTKNPNQLQTFDPQQINAFLFDEIIEDAGTIRLHMVDGVPNHVCRTAFDAGVFCFPIQMAFDGRISYAGQTHQLVSHEQVQETCDIPTYHKDSYIEQIAAETTGLEVLWDDEGNPETLFFGCIGEAGGMGNFSTAYRNGTVAQTIHGAHPGGILFGTELVREKQTLLSSPQSNPRGIRSRMVTCSSYLAVFAVVATVVVALRKTLIRRRVVRLYSRVYGVEGSFSVDGVANASDEAFESFPGFAEPGSTIAGLAAFGIRSGAAYVELSTVPPHEALI